MRWNATLKMCIRDSQKAVENLGVSVDLQREQGRDHLHGADEQGHRQNGREKNLQISGTDGKKIAQLAFQFYVQIGSLLFCQRRWVPAPYSPGIVSGGRKRGVRRPGRIYAYYYTAVSYTHLDGREHNDLMFTK